MSVLDFIVFESEFDLNKTLILNLNLGFIMVIPCRVNPEYAECEQNMKKLKRMLRAKRAFSTVIAALILMLLAVAAGVVVYSYVIGWLGGATQTTGGAKGQLEFDSIYADATGDTIKIYVRNVGGKNLLLSKIYVDGAEKANATAIPTAGVAINVQSVAYLEVSHTMTAGYFYEVKVTCKDGTLVSQSVEAK